MALPRALLRYSQAKELEGSFCVYRNSLYVCDCLLSFVICCVIINILRDTIHIVEYFIYCACLRNISVKEESGIKNLLVIVTGR